MTQEFLQDAIVEDLKQLFFPTTPLTNSLGVERAVKIVPQGLPIREGDDEEKPTRKRRRSLMWP